MKKLIAVLLVLCIFGLSGCGSYKQGFALEESGGRKTITLNNFEGRQKIEFDYLGPGDPSLYYCTDITGGSVTIYLDEGWLSPTRELFTASADTNTDNNGAYLLSKKVIVIIEAVETTSGKIVFSFSRFK